MLAVSARAGGSVCRASFSSCLVESAFARSKLEVKVILGGLKLVVTGTLSGRL